MAKSFFVFSTLACDQLYTDWLPGGGDMPIKGDSVLIKGGAGIANDRFITPVGVMTEVDESQMALLEQNHHFNQHRDNGFITVRQKSADVEKVAPDMNQNDESKPLTPTDYADGAQGVEVKTNDAS